MDNIEKFLPEKYPDLSGSKPVERAVQKEIQEGGSGPATKEARIDMYLNRVQKVLESGTRVNERRGFDLLKHKILERYTTKYEEIPENYWKSHEEEGRRRGESGDWAQTTDEQKEEMKRKHAEVVLTDQRASLEQWIDYFASPQSEDIPRNLKYWVFRNVLNLQELVKKKEGDKEHIEFPKRSKGTVKPFPDINHEALSYVVDAVIKKLEGKSIEFEYDIQLEERETFNSFLGKEDFAKLYAWANELMNPIPEHLLPVTEGRWEKYPQGSDSEKLVQTIRGRGTGWCTAGLNTARAHLLKGDFYVFYSLDDNNEATVPRIAIRMEGHDKIAEDPRGIAYKQNLDPYMVPVLEKKLDEFGSVGEVFKKKSANMKLLTDIEGKTKRDEPLTKSDLIFLYELDMPIEGFGYKKDPRIAELRSQRNLEEDMPIVFECTKEQIAHRPSEINKTTKAYVGKYKGSLLQMDNKEGDIIPIFNLLQQYNVEHIYAPFPEGRIRKEELEIGGKTTETLEKELREKGIEIFENALELLQNKDFTTLKHPEHIMLVRLEAGDLGLRASGGYVGVEEIYFYAKKLGLEYCPPETGPYYRLKYTDQPEGLYESVNIYMEPITRKGRVFELKHFREAALILESHLASPKDYWKLDQKIVLRLPTTKTSSSHQ